MRGGGVLFTAARDVVKPDANGGGLIVQLYSEEGGDPYPLPVEKLVQESDGVLQGVLSQGNRQGSAAPSLRSQNCPAKITPVKGKTLRTAVALFINKGDPLEYPLQAIMVALNLQWIPLRRPDAGATRTRVETAPSGPQLLRLEWLVGTRGDERASRRRASQARMVGFSAREGEDGVRPRAAAQLLAAAAGDMAAVDGVEAGLLAAATAQTEGVEEAAATARLRRAGA
eukprot:554576-Pleurochrysis_carterae.AAC.1